MTETRLVPSVDSLASLGIAAFCDNGAALRDMIHERDTPATLPERVTRGLIDAGVLRLMVPERLGGLGRSPSDVLKVLRALATVSGSLGWVAMVATETPALLARYPADVLDELYRRGPDVWLASAADISGDANRVADGLTVSGEWRLVTGARFANWFMLRSRGADGEPVSVLLPSSDVRVRDDAGTTGLAATSTSTVEVDSAIVPQRRSFSGRPDVGVALEAALQLKPSTHFALQKAAVAIGIADGALEAVVARRLSSGPASEKRRLEDPLLLDAIGRTRALSATAGPVLVSMMDRLLAEIFKASDDRDSFVDAEVLAVSRHFVDASSRCVRSLATFLGSTVLSGSDRVGTCKRDVETIAQHANISIARYAQAGEALLKAVASERRYDQPST